MRKNKRFTMGLAVFFALMCATWAVQVSEARSDSSAKSPEAGDENVQAPVKHQGAPSFQERRPRYRVAPGDVLDLNFPFSPEFNQTVTVQPDGFVTLRNVGEFYVQGKTTPELAADLHQAYGKILHDPVITVDLKDFQKPFFIAGGEVGHPGKYDLREDTTASEAIAIAGGFTDSSKHSQVLLFRRLDDNSVEVKKLNLKKMLNSADLKEDVYLRPGDMLYVPKNRISKIKRFLPTEALSLYFGPLR